MKPVETKQPSSRISGTLVSLGQLREMSRIVAVRTSSAKLCFFMLRRGDDHHETSFQYNLLQRIVPIYIRVATAVHVATVCIHLHESYNRRGACRV